MPFYEYMCETHGIFMEVRPISERLNSGSCPECGADGKFIVSMPTIKLEGHSGHFPSAADKWARLHERHGKSITGDKPRLRPDGSYVGSSEGE